MSKVDLLNSPLYQSPYAYLQAAGSDQSDGTAAGIHLRWDFFKSLGDNHIAKGNLAQSPPYQTSVGYNKPNDFIRVYRSEYNKKFDVQIKFKNNLLPNQEISTGPTREWHYNNLVPFNQVPTNTTNIFVRFIDTVQYDTIRSTMNPLKPENFIKQYTGVIEIETPGKLMFAADIDVDFKTPNQKPSAYLRIETVSLTDSLDSNSKQISSRKKFIGTDKKPFHVGCENIKYLRFDYSNSYPIQVNIETYQDYIISVNAQGNAGKWDVVNDFALTVTDSIAYLRLEDPANYVIDKRWPKYNESDNVSGAFKVKVLNYKDRWIPAANPLNGLKDAVNQYLLRSIPANNLKANASLPVEQTHDLYDNTHFDISYLDMLRIVSLDFHVARMLGLGTIDQTKTGSDKNQFIYCLEYLTNKALEPNQPANYVATHIFMTLPTSRQDYRLPPNPVLKPVSYGQSIDNGTGQPTPLTDANGYAFFDDVRFINLGRQQFNYEKPFTAFWADTTLYDLCDETPPVQFGVEYRKNTEGNFRKPEILNDPNYLDFAALPETVAIPEQGANPVFVHQEREEGIHVYGMYSINWFSRVSPVSPTEQTNLTDFPKRNTLLPPLNFSVQLIQEESPRIFTTAPEQTLLANLPAGDKTLIRATFDWNHFHHNAYQFADKAELFFKQNEPQNIRGEITAVNQLANHQVQVTTTSYLILSTNPMQVIAPEIFPTDVTRFIGGLFTVDQQSYIISNIIAQSNGQNPIFVLDQVKTTDSWDPNHINTFTTTETYLSPQSGGRFIVIENTASDLGWDLKLHREIYIEKFFTNSEIIILNSTGNDGTYIIDSVVPNGTNTEIVTKEIVKSSIANGSLKYNRSFRLSGIDQPSNSFLVSGNITSEISLVSSLNIYGSKNNDAIYSIVSAIYNNPNTVIQVTGTIPDSVNVWGYLSFQKSVSITGVNTAQNKFTVAGNLVSQIDAPYKESRLEEDGSTTRLTVGGITQQCVITPIMDPVNPSQRTGAYDIYFPNTFVFPHHIDPEIDWYKGIIRISDSNLILNKRRIKELEVWSVELDQNGNIVSPLHVVAFDSTDFTDANASIYPILIGSGTTVNFHPSYRLYLKSDIDNNNNTVDLSEAYTLPAQGGGSKITFMGVRSVDTSVGNKSRIVPPVPLLAQEIVNPVAPDSPFGPDFATRPDYYGKSTYTFDVKLNDTASGRRPFALVFYRCDERKILDTLYSRATVSSILTALKTQRDNGETDQIYYLRWYKLAEGLVEAYTLAFPVLNNYGFPIPDNANYRIPSRNPQTNVHPFDGTTVPGAQVQFNVDGNLIYMNDVVKESIDGAFLPLSEQPVIYKFLKGGVVASAKKPVFRNANGDLVPPVPPNDPQYDPDVFDPFPMAVQFAKDTTGTLLLPSDNNYNNNANDFYVRFTDYKIDGAANNIYFYFGVELSNKLQVSGRSLMKGPVLLVNAAPAEQPGIRKVTTQLQNTANNIPTAVRFELNPYNTSEGITKFGLFRSILANDSLTIRTMDFVKFVNVGDPIVDDFPNLQFPLYGEALFYRIVAYREILNELSLTEFIPSKPSNTALSSIVDVVNPPAPQLRSVNGNTTTTQLQNVILKWSPTAYNATYKLQKQNSSGNWVEIFSVKSNNAIQYPPLDQNNQPDFTNFPVTALLDRQDADGNLIYHRFRVQVVNSSGLLNLSEKELTLAKGCTDLQEIDTIVSYTDSNHSINPIVSTDVDEGVRNPQFMTFNNLLVELPAGHNTFIQTDITVTDDLGNTFTKTVSTNTPTVTFNNGDGGLVLDNSNPNRIYTIKTLTKTDNCSSGAVQLFTLKYISSPCHDLLQLVNIVSLTDSTHIVPVLANGNINDGVAYPLSLSFMDISNAASLGQSFNGMDIKVTDDLGNSFTQSISANNQGGSVIFNDGDGGLLLGSANPNRRYTVEATLHTDLCSAGKTYSYSIAYTFTPCDQLTPLTSIVSFSDNNGSSFSPLANENILNTHHAGGSMTFGNIVTSLLPSGHTFDHIDVILEDDLGGTAIKTITTLAPSVTFNNGDGGLVLDNSVLNRTYTVVLVLYTDLCTDGTTFSYSVKYLA